MQESALKTTEELPTPSAELVLYRAHVQALLRVLGRKKGERYLRLMAGQLAAEENLSNVLSIRPSSQALEVRMSRRQAATIFDRLMPVFLASLPDT